MLSGNFNQAAGRGPPAAVRRQQRPLLHQRHRHRHQGRGGHRALPFRSRLGGPPGAVRQLRRSDRRRQRRRESVLRDAHRGHDRHASPARRPRGHPLRPHRAPPHRVRPAQGQLPARRRLVEVRRGRLRCSPAATANTAASRPRSPTTRSTRAKWLTDLDVAYSHRRFSVHVGAQNLFDEFPDLNTPVNSFNGIQTYPSHSPFGMNGRFVYGRVTFKF